MSSNEHTRIELSTEKSGHVPGGVQDRFIQGLTISWFCVFFCCSGICEHIYSPRMKTIPLPERVAQMATITRMERGHISVIRTGPDGQPYHNLQHREDGRNVTEYIPREELPAVQENVAAYEHFMKLVDEHAGRSPGRASDAYFKRIFQLFLDFGPKMTKLGG